MFRLAVATVVLFVAVAPSAHAAGFQTSSGNVRCIVARTGSGSPFVQCHDMRAQRTVSLLPKSRPVELVFRPTRRPRIIVARGESLTTRVFRCTATRYGMRCSSRRSQHGFALGSGVFRRF